MLPIGVIGAGTEWDAVWRPAFAQLSRLVVASFYDPVAARGERVAEENEWPLAASARQVLETPKLRGLVVLDPGWLGNWIIEQADRRGLPVFVSPRESSLENLAGVFERSTGE